MANENKRLPYIDIARAFAIIFIVIGHAIPYSEHCHVLLKFIYSFHVFLFFFLSGYTFSINKNFIDFIKNKFLRIMVPYYFWAILFLIPFIMFGQSVGANLGTDTSFSIKDTFMGIIYGSGDGLKQNSPLWFLPALFSTVSIYYFLIKLTTKHKSHAILLLIAMIIISFLCNEFVAMSLPLGINNALIIGPMFYIGYLFKKSNLTQKLFKHFYYIIILAILGTICAFKNTMLHYMGMDYGILPLAFISGLCLSLTCLYVSYKINSNNLLEYIGKNTMGILIFHKLIIVLFQSKLGIISNLMKSSNWFLELLLCLLVSSITIAFSIFVTNIIKLFLPITVGEKYNKTRAV